MHGERQPIYGRAARQPIYGRDRVSPINLWERALSAIYSRGSPINLWERRDLSHRIVTLPVTFQGHARGLATVTAGELATQCQSGKAFSTNCRGTASRTAIRTPSPNTTNNAIQPEPRHQALQARASPSTTRTEHTVYCVILSSVEYVIFLTIGCSCSHALLFELSHSLNDTTIQRYMTFIIRSMEVCSSTVQYCV